MKRGITREQVNGRDGWSIDDSQESRTFYVDGIPATEKALVRALKTGLERDVEFIAHDKYIHEALPVIVVLFDESVEQYTIDNCQDVFGRCDGKQVDFDEIDQVFSEVWNGTGFVTWDELYGMMYKEENHD